MLFSVCSQFELSQRLFMPFADVKDGHNSIENYWSNFKWPEQFNIDEIPI